MSKYPHDEFDKVPVNGDREGTHRAFVSFQDPRRGLWPVLICGVLALAVGAVMFFGVLPHSKDNFRSLGLDRGAAAAPSGQAAAPGATPSAGTGGEIPGVTAAPTQSAPPTEPGEDRSTRIGVYNATGQDGYAGDVADQVRAMGYDKLKTGKWPAGKRSKSVVLYTKEERLPTAKAIAKRLKIDEVELSPYQDRAVSVVLGADALGN